MERASITIDAPIDVVWKVFADVERWPTWTRSVTSVELIDGRDAPRRHGAHPPAAAAHGRVDGDEVGARTIVDLDRNGPGCPHGSDSHVLTSLGGTTLVEQVIVSRGPAGRLLAILWRSLTQRYLAMEAAGLKARCEQVAAANPRRRAGAGPVTERRDDLLRRVVAAAANGGLARRSLRELAAQWGPATAC